MRRRLALVVLVVVVVVGTIIILNGHSTSSHRATATTQAPNLPVLHEPFTLLVCDPTTTIGVEGCLEHRLVRDDQRINRLRRDVFASLFSDGARRRFVRAEVLWFNYRQAACSSESDVNEGGSLAPIDFANCAVRLDGQHVTNLSQQATSFRVDAPG